MDHVMSMSSFGPVGLVLNLAQQLSSSISTLNSFSSHLNSGVSFVTRSRLCLSSLGSYNIGYMSLHTALIVQLDFSDPLTARHAALSSAKRHGDREDFSAHSQHHQ